MNISQNESYKLCILGIQALSMKQFITLLILLLSFTACSTKKKSLNSKTIMASTETKMELHDELAQKYIIVDGHVDLPYRLRVMNFRLEKEFLEIPVQSDKGDFDFVRSREGGLDAPFMSIYIPADYQKDPGRSKSVADSLINMVEAICDKNPDFFEIAHKPEDVERIFKDKKLALPMGMENGSGIEDDLANIKYFADRGINYITLTHSKDNLICDSSYDTTRTWQGLSPFGFKVVEEMNNQGVMVDISHVSDASFYQAIKHSKVPVIASHSSCRKFTPDFERNMDDDMLKALAENEGVIMINFGSTFIDQKIKDERWQLGLDMNAYLEEKGMTRESDGAKEVMEKYLEDSELTFSDVKVVADHIDHVVSVAGVDHVGFGSDFDGVGDSLPTGLKDVSDYPNLIKELLARGYTESDIAKICSGNLLRVWKIVEEYADAK